MRIRILASLVAIVAVYSEKGIAAAHIASRGTASEVLWATHILLLRTDSAEMGERVRPAHGPEYRDATLRLVIQDVLKGHVRQPIGKTFTHATRVRLGWWRGTGTMEQP